MRERERKKRNFYMQDGEKPKSSYSFSPFFCYLTVIYYTYKEEVNKKKRKKKTKRNGH